MTPRHVYYAMLPKDKRTRCYIKYRPFPDHMYNQAVFDASATNGDYDFNNPQYRRNTNRVVVVAVNKPADSDMYKWEGYDGV